MEAEGVSNLKALHLFMQDDVIDNVSKGVLKQFLVSEDVIVVIKKGWTIFRKVFTTVIWKTEPEEVICSCNRLVYGGVPCKHFAQNSKHRIL